MILVTKKRLLTKIVRLIADNLKKQYGLSVTKIHLELPTYPFLRIQLTDWTYFNQPFFTIVLKFPNELLLNILFSKKIKVSMIDVKLSERRGKEIIKLDLKEWPNSNIFKNFFIEYEINKRGWSKVYLRDVHEISNMD